MSSDTIRTRLVSDAIHHYGENVDDCMETLPNGTMILNVKLPLCTGGIFATYPAKHLTLASGFFDQVMYYMICLQHMAPSLDTAFPLLGFRHFPIGVGYICHM